MNNNTRLELNHLRDMYDRVRKERNLLADKLDKLLSGNKSECKRNHVDVTIEVLKPRGGGRYRITGFAHVNFTNQGIPFTEFSVPILRDMEDGSVFCVSKLSQYAVDMDGQKTEHCDCGARIMLSEPVVEVSNPMRKYIVECFLIQQGIMEREEKEAPAPAPEDETSKVETVVEQSEIQELVG